ncbi:MAG: TetR/AcrR family transcriptional regulator [Acidobacteria bacterium Pan2503]|uniref:TetR/AcrR family transcriptional regulator n=1 Tax=Candidatus Acidiferrum panamense TaxID=2741543 RepID=A0A7V8NUN3_9BACT|nr:TetR/AcrR family transcriptional regulator [Candidatus Acidoferrum panamensis]
MRKSREETARTRERIIEVASEEIRANGVAGSGLAGVMKAAGLTPGGFYKHFGSKDQLVAESVGRAFDQILSELRFSIKGKRPDTALATLVSEYLSVHLRDQVEKSCPLSAIGTELRRTDSGTSAVVRSGMERLTSLVAQQITGVSGRRAKARAHGMVAAMVGGIVLSRLAHDRYLADSILRDTRKFILHLKRSRG